ncbi:GNAT family N-acetyltransferase [bacterium]|nr:GNAT family N-acetyltransferase [bacterium]
MKSTEPKLEFRAWDDLSPGEIHAYYRLRQQVFVLYQNSAYVDADVYDPVAFHAWIGQPPSGCVRVLPPGTQYAEASIGRIAVATEARGGGLAHRLTTSALQEVYRRFGPVSVRILAQAYLLHFYAQYGFEAEGPYVWEDGILHREMLRPASRFHAEQ